MGKRTKFWGELLSKASRLSLHKPEAVASNAAWGKAGYN